ncbi:DNA fragmentation factor subunit alpha [Anarhichas minor]|uniref:DNA fragmentation factor subunit alpha n=1 Tax=Anarhichas minor TaxID=65739 RepID=UPI003F7338FA
MTDRKPCKVCNFTRQKSYGVAVPSLDDLKMKGSEFLGFSPGEPVTVVLENDGTIVEDQAYFLCLPLNTKFMLLHEKETWSPVRRVDGGTAWMARDSLLLEADIVEADSVDVSSAAAPWLDLAQQLKQDLASIILMSEADLQTLVDAPCLELASALGFQVKKAEDLQETVQRVLDRREEERQSKELLQLYLKAAEKEDGQQEDQSQEAGDVVVDAMEVDSASGFMTRTLMVLKGKTSPETRLSTEDLQMVVSRGVQAMEQVLGWDRMRTSALLQACEAELTRRLQQVQAVQSIRSNTQLESS